MNNRENIQREVCRRYAGEFLPCPPEAKLGIALATEGSLWPINGLRHTPEGDTCGWYIWWGEEFSEDPGFFAPMHVAHMDTRCPQLIPYLGLSPGWRFLIAEGYEDIWFDPKLLDV